MATMLRRLPAAAALLSRRGSGQSSSHTARSPAWSGETLRRCVLGLPLGGLGSSPRRCSWASGTDQALPDLHRRRRQAVRSHGPPQAEGQDAAWPRPALDAG
jgi:hypothetical protein